MAKLRTLMKGNIVKFDGHFTKVVDYKAIDFQTCAILENKDGLVGAVPVSDIKWNSKQFVVEGRDEH